MDFPVVFDNEPLLAREVKRVKDGLRQSERLEAVCARHYDVDVPQYNAWHDEAFGVVLRRIHVARRALVAMVERHDRVVGLAHAEGISPVRAHALICAEDAAYANGSAEVRARIDDLRASRPRAKDPDTDSGTGVDAEGAAEPDDARRTDDHRLRLESLFRTIARRIHPDTIDAILKTKNVDWLHRTWMRAVSARERGDLEQLTVVHGQLLVAARALHSSGLADLRALTKSLATVYARREAADREARQSPAWNFSKKKSRNALHAEITKSYAATLFRLERDLAQLGTIHDDWMRAASPAARARRRRRRAR